MGDIPHASAVRGRTIHYIWLDGPTKGKTHEHVFHEDGTVEWREVGGTEGKPGVAALRPKPSDGKLETQERVPYAAVEAGRDVYVVSYLASSGYTLTVVLNFETSRLVGVASSGSTWVPVQGRFELVS